MWRIDHRSVPRYYYSKLCCKFQVKGGFRFTKFVQPVLLNRDTPKEVMCNVTGWGVITTKRMNVTLELRKNSPLQVVEEQLITWEKCKQLATVVPVGTFCLAHTEEGAAPRYGDADGAIVCQEKLTGFVSYAYGCAAPVQHAFSTDIFFFKDWIAKKLKKSYEELDQSLHKKHEIFTKLQS